MGGWERGNARDGNCQYILVRQGGFTEKGHLSRD